MLTLGWILSTGVGMVTVILVASNFFSGLTPQVMDGIFAFGFIAAAVGGLESPVGAIVAGVTIGIVMQFVTDYVNSNAVIIVRSGHPDRLAHGAPERGLHGEHVEARLMGKIVSSRAVRRLRARSWSSPSSCRSWRLSRMRDAVALIAGPGRRGGAA